MASARIGLWLWLLVGAAGCVAPLRAIEVEGEPRAILPGPDAPDSAQLVVGRVGGTGGLLRHGQTQHFVVTDPAGHRSVFVGMGDVADVTFRVPAGQKLRVSYFSSGCGYGLCEPTAASPRFWAVRRCHTEIEARAGEQVHLVADIHWNRRRCRFQAIAPAERVRGLGERAELEVVLGPGRPASDFPLRMIPRHRGGLGIRSGPPELLSAEVLAFRIVVAIHGPAVEVLEHVRAGGGEEELHPARLLRGETTRLVIPARDASTPPRRVTYEALRRYEASVTTGRGR
ncbi:hypothetical protein [Nannocystis punicea]|uniref:Uncharacterized protein n=1 Tax=Nannocystis punicea TaxID=2995304 RepID=A0ABY7HG08_9BACT|nr:hypothetical protein [Nannocystis poenicansa]WAS98043.1 hypothetical protein O0S08_18025 [Nannocystis poenicansa]